jgi:hypothetical protein
VAATLMVDVVLFEHGATPLGEGGWGG